jgi:O-antigen ligase
VTGARLAILATLVPCLALPLVLAFANRSTPLMLGVSVLLMLAAIFVASGRSGLMRVSRDAAALPASSCLGLVLVAGLASAAFAHSPAASLHMLGQFGIAATLSLLLLAGWPRLADPRWPLLVLAGMLAALAVIALDIESGFLLKRSVGSRSDDYVHNRPLVTLVLLLWPVAAGLLASGRARLAFLLAALLALVVLRSVSQSALLGLFCGTAAWLLMRLAPRAAISLAVAGSLALLALAPWTGALLAQLIGESASRMLAAAHVSERIAIWSAYGEAARLAPFTGWGFNASAGLGKAPALAELHARSGNILMDSHPHHAFLQVWLEFGVLGALVAAALVLALFRLVWRLDAFVRPFAFALVTSALAIGMVSHGLWQSWWWAGIGLAVTFLAAAASLRR